MAASSVQAGELLPPPRDLSHFFSEATKLRQPSLMKQQYKFFLIPGIGNVSGGLPHVQYFPYDTLEAQIAKPERWMPSPNRQTSQYEGHADGLSDEDAMLLADRVAAVKLTTPGAAGDASASSSPDRLAQTHMVVPKVASAPLPGQPAPTPDKTIDLATALQYGNAGGYPPLVAWLRAFTTEHMVPQVPYRGGADIILTVGSTDGLSKTFELFVNNWSPVLNDVRDRPGLLCETFVYGNVLNQAAPKGLNIVPIEADADGALAYGPGSLEDVLAHWDDAQGRRPHLMYTVTMGHNPTGYVLGLERRKQIYDVCSRFDVIIIEDDPYFYLQFPSSAINEAASRGLPRPRLTVTGSISETNAAAVAAGQRPPLRSSGYDFLDSLAPSYLTMDVDGRVVRLDTFSKTVAPGCRLGWITAQPSLIERYTRICEMSTQNPSGFVQAMISELILGPQPAQGSSSPAAATTATASATGFFRSAAAAALAPHNRERLAAFSQANGSSSSSTGAKTVFGGWQMDGWVRWLEGLRGEYERRMNRMCTILDGGAFQLKQGTPVRSSDAEWGVITKTQLYSFDWPRGGMFLWMRVHFEAHPLWQAPRPVSAGEATDEAPADGASGTFDGPTMATALILFLTTKPYLVLVSPGVMFSATDAIHQAYGYAYLRLCFAAESDENVDACSKRFVAGIHRFWKIKKARELEDLLQSANALAAESAAAYEAGEMGNLSTWTGC